MDIQDPDYYSADTFVYNKVDDIAWKKKKGKNGGNLTGSYMMQVLPKVVFAQTIILQLMKVCFFLF